MKIFEQYKQTRDAIDILEDELDALKPKLVEELKKSDGPVDIADANFTLRTNKTYKYSETVVALDKKIKDVTKKFKEKMADKVKELAEAKKAEVKEGVAEVKSKKYTPVMKVI